MRHTQNQVNHLFQILEKEPRITQNRITENLMSLAMISPNDFSYSYFSEPGYTAVIRGEVAHIAKCKPVIVTPISPKDGLCYNEPVVEYKNITQYMTPRSRILIRNGQLIPCSSEIGPMYNLNGRWIVQIKSRVVPSISPQTIKIEPIEYKFEPLESLANGGLYTPDTILEYQKILTSPMEESVLKSRIVSAINEGHSLPYGADFANAFDKDSVLNLRAKMRSIVDDVLGPLYSWANPFSALMMIIIGIKLVIALVNYIVNFRQVMRQEGLFKTMLISLFDSISNLVIRKLKETRQRDQLLTLNQSRESGIV